MIELFDGKGGLVEGRLQKIERAAAEFMALEDPVKVHPHSTQWHVCAAFGTLRGGRADWLVEKCTVGFRKENRLERMERLILAAAKQCQRLHEMKLNPPLKIDGLLHLVAKSKQSFVATAEATPLVDVLTSARKESSGLIIIGPEGDFTEREVKLIMEAGAKAVGLGQHRLRVETATMALLATLMLWSDARHIADSLE